MLFMYVCVAGENIRALEKKKEEKGG